MADDSSEGKFYATFERFADLKKWQESILNQDLFREPSDEEQKDEDWAEQRFSFTVCPILFSAIFVDYFLQLNEYQEQSYLLDPFLEELVTPVVEHLKSYARTVVEDPSKSSSSVRVNRVSTLLYYYTKFRGYKTISKSTRKNLQLDIG
jgi:hypothetical protein